MIGSPPVADVRIRAMRQADVPAVTAIEERTYARPWPPVVFRAELRRDDRVYLVAVARGGRTDVRGRVRGYAGAVAAAGEAHVLTVAVDPDHQRRGIGFRLVLELLAELRRRDAADVTLEVRESNHGAQALYAGLGFVSAGVRPGYYQDDGEDARILWLHGLPSPEVRAQLRSAAAARGVPVPADL